MRFGRVAPTIAVTDIDRARAFWTGVLGFTETFTNGDPIGFAIVERDTAEIHLTRAPQHTPTTANVAQLVDDATALYDRLTAADTRIIKRLRDADYGMRTFVFADPDGNRFDVGQYLE
jgi:catechol 2,3-dioxygenase-like lactoylglutathione lyase family enzyme